SFLMEAENHKEEHRDWKGRSVLFYAMEYEQRYIWGATAAILRNLYERLYAPAAGRSVTGKPPPASPDRLSVATALWLVRPETQAVFACLNQEGCEVRAVGGAVGNALTGRAATEVDFATTAKPDDVMRLAAKAGLKTKPTGLAPGTVTLI